MKLKDSMRFKDKEISQKGYELEQVACTFHKKPIERIK